MSRPKLIITADDYGMSPRFNHGILEAARAGLITGISVIIKRKYIRKTELLALDIPLGLHLELENSSPYREITSQIERFEKRFGKLPAYLDGHQHKHLTPRNIRNIVRVAKRFRLPIRSRLPEDRSLLKKNGITTPDNFISWHPSRLTTLIKRIQQTKEFPVSELVVHPGYPDKNCQYPYNQERALELEFLLSSRFKKLIRDFQLVSYTGITSDAQHVRKTTATR